MEESDIEDVWPKDMVLPCHIIELNQDVLTLQYPNGRIQTWERTRTKKKGGETEPGKSPVIPLKPVAVNLNKNRSSDKDRYLCMDLELHLHDLMPDEEMPRMHPRARDAMITYLSSLIYTDVKTFDDAKVVIKKLQGVLNPYMNGLIREIKVNHVVIASSPEKVEEFMIGHMPVSGMETEGSDGVASEATKEN